MTKLPFNVDMETFSTVIRILDTAKTRISRENILEMAFGVTPYDDSEVSQCKLALENISRASKTDWGLNITETILGYKGYMQATLIKHKSYFEFIKANTITKYSPKNVDDVKRLVDLYFEKISSFGSLTSEEVATELSHSHFYVLGTILPSIGMIKSCYADHIVDIKQEISNIIELHSDNIKIISYNNLKDDMKTWIETVDFNLTKEYLVEYILNSDKKSKKHTLSPKNLRHKNKNY